MEVNDRQTGLYRNEAQLTANTSNIGTGRKIHSSPLGDHLEANGSQLEWRVYTPEIPEAMTSGIMGTNKKTYMEENKERAEKKKDISWEEKLRLGQRSEAQRV